MLGHPSSEETLLRLNVMQDLCSLLGAYFAVGNSHQALIDLVSDLLNLLFVLLVVVHFLLDINPVLEYADGS